jgi:hypothetical protein
MKESNLEKVDQHEAAVLQEKATAPASGARLLPLGLTAFRAR